MMMNRAVQLSMTVGLRSITNSWNMFSGAISMLVQARSNILKRIIFSVNQFIYPQQLPKVEKPTLEPFPYQSLVTKVEKYIKFIEIIMLIVSILKRLIVQES